MSRARESPNVALEQLGETSARLALTRQATTRALASTERALRAFSTTDARVDANDRSRTNAISRTRADDDDVEGQRESDQTLNSLVRQLESFAEKRTGNQERIGKGKNGERERGRVDKWSTRSNGAEDDVAGGDENSLVGYSIMYGSTVDDNASVADLDDFNANGSEYSVDASFASTKNRHHGTIASVNGRINAVNDSLQMSKQRLHESIAELEAEVGEMNDFEKFKDDGMPVVGNRKTGQPVIDMFASQGKRTTAPPAEYNPFMKSLSDVFGCCSTRRV